MPYYRPFHDEEERLAVEKIVGELDDLHPARAAYLEGLGTLAISKVVVSAEMRARLEAVYVAGLNRYLKRLQPHTDSAGRA